MRPRLNMTEEQRKIHNRKLSKLRTRRKRYLDRLRLSNPEEYEKIRIDKDLITKLVNDIFDDDDDEPPKTEEVNDSYYEQKPIKLELMFGLGADENHGGASERLESYKFLQTHSSSKQEETSSPSECKIKKEFIKCEEIDIDYGNSEDEMTYETHSDESNSEITTHHSSNEVFIKEALQDNYLADELNTDVTISSLANEDALALERRKRRRCKPCKAERRSRFTKFTCGSCREYLCLKHCAIVCSDKCAKEHASSQKSAKEYGKRKRCVPCMAETRTSRMTKYTCVSCGKYMCLQHCVFLCVDGCDPQDLEK